MDGMSLFQGVPSIHINNSAQDRLEEQEELEDQKRLNKELKDKLANAFDEFIDDDEASSVNSSGNFTMEAGNNNSAGQRQTRTGMPPTYIQSLHHLKEQHPESQNYCETPKSNICARHQEDVITTPFTPYAGGDGQNNYFHHEIRAQLNGVNNSEARQDYMNNEKLKVMYEMRVKECQQLADQIEKLDTEVEGLRARLVAAVNDRDKAELSLQEAHHLLASTKHNLIELEQRVTSLSQKLLESEQDKEQLKLELRSANISLQDLQQRLNTMQVAHSHDTDALFREQQERHREEIERLQNDLTKAKHRLDEKDNEIKTLEKRCKEREREKEEVLIEKGGTINRLASELEAAQSKLVCGEAARLKERVAQLAADRHAAKEQLKELGSKLETTARELVMCRNKLTANQKEYENWQNTLHQILLEALPDKTLLGEPPSPGKLATLKEVLNRYKLQSQKLASLQEELAKRDKKVEYHRKQESELRNKLEEQKGIEMQLGSRIAVLQSKVELLGSSADTDLVDSYKQQNEQLQNELEQVRSEFKNLDLKYTELEMENEKMKREKGSRASIVQEANNDLLRELERCSGQLKDTLKENGELKNLYLQACSSRDASNRELKDVQSKIQKERDMFKSQEKEYIERIEREKQHAEKVSSDLNSCKEELERANKRISELQKEFTDKQREFTEKLNKFLEDEKTALRKDMESCPQCDKYIKRIRQLDEHLSKCILKLATKESNEALMTELKSKGEFFQQYLAERFRRLSEQRSVGTSTDPCRNPDHELDPNPDPDPVDNERAVKTALMMKEKAIREQIAEKFTLEMKTMEMNNARKIKEMEDEHLSTMKKLKELLERKAKEIESLKEFIISERNKVTQILDSKENEISILIKEHNELQAECQKARDHIIEWRLKAERYKERLTRLGSMEDVIKKEKEELTQKAAVSTKEWRAKTEELKAKVAQIEQKYVKLQNDHKTLQEKYKNVKKTVTTYKEYISKRDAHVNNEMNRIQDEYRKIFLKLQNQLNYYVNCRVQEDRSKGKPAQAQQYQNYDYTEKINKLKEDLANLAESPFSVELNNQQ